MERPFLFFVMPVGVRSCRQNSAETEKLKLVPTS